MEQRNLFDPAEFQPRVSRARRPPRRAPIHFDLEGFKAALAVVVEHGRRGHCPDEATCPRCGRVGATRKAFGVRMVNGRARAQSWCRACRKAPKKAEATRDVSAAFAPPASSRKQPPRAPLIGQSAELF